MIELTPTPKDLSDLLVRMCQEPWPTSEEDRLRYFSALHLTDGEVLEDPPHHRDPDSRSRRFTTALPGQVDGNCSMFRDQFLGLQLFAYNQFEPNQAFAREGYAALKQLLTEAFGDPVEEWGPPNQPACLWRPGPLMLDMYCFQEHSSGIMVGPAHSERSAASDAAAFHRQQTNPRPLPTTAGLLTGLPTGGDNH
jgi:hypothetical protein